MMMRFRILNDGRTMREDIVPQERARKFLQNFLDMWRDTLGTNTVNRATEIRVDPAAGRVVVITEQGFTVTAEVTK